MVPVIRDAYAVAVPVRYKPGRNGLIKSAAGRAAWKALRDPWARNRASPRRTIAQPIDVPALGSLPRAAFPVRADRSLVVPGPELHGCSNPARAAGVLGFGNSVLFGSQV